MCDLVAALRTVPDAKPEAQELIQRVWADGVFQQTAENEGGEAQPQKQIQEVNQHGRLGHADADTIKPNEQTGVPHRLRDHHHVALVEQLGAEFEVHGPPRHARSSIELGHVFGILSMLSSRVSRAATR